MEQPILLTHVRRYRIVVGLDLSEYADIVLEHALDQAARHQAPELHLVTVREKRRPSAEEVQQALWQRVAPALETFNRHAPAAWRARLYVRRGKPEEQLALLAADVRADLLVIGHFGLHHPGRGDRSVPSRVLQAATCPTLVVGMPAELPHQCAACAAVREATDGDLWFCPQHAASAAASEQTMTPMTEWAGGAFRVTRAA